MASIQESPVDGLIKAVAGKMEKMKEFEPPAWAPFVKTGANKDRPPQQENWWFLRAASILRKTYIKKGIGVNRLKVEYGSRKNRGHKPEHMYTASGAVIRKMMQQLENAGFLEAKKNEKGNRTLKRIITAKGTEFLK